MSDLIKNVSDTSIWVAHYRAIESQRADALFQDPYASILVGEHASSIEAIKSPVSKWTQWSVVIRTYIIDQMIHALIARGVTTFLNAGAGLDSRPYRMRLGENISWIEVDFPHVIEYKNQQLGDIKPNCKLERIGLDLSNRDSRQSVFARIAQKHSNIAVLTEGVLPYLTQDQVSELSEDLTHHPGFRYWICEYISPKSYRYLKNKKRMKILKNAPFQFYPEDWMGFFESRGWSLSDSQYYSEISESLGRPTPIPAYFKLFELILGKQWASQFKRMSGFLLWGR